jgi:predicted Fe-Mo cluster-binding NifX family protein
LVKGFETGKADKNRGVPLWSTLQIKNIHLKQTFMKKIAIPVIEGTLCKHFGHCQEFHVFTIENSEIREQTALTPPPHAPGVIPDWISKNGVTDVIVGGIGQRAIDIFNNKNVNVYVGAPSKKSEAIIKDFLNGTLETQANMCDH